MAVARVDREQLRQLLRDRDEADQSPGHHESVREQVLARRQDLLRHAPGERLGVARIHYDEILLARTVDAQRLFIDARIEPVREPAAARANGRSSILERRPRETAPRIEVP